jgi:hypothetical protein
LKNSVDEEGQHDVGKGLVVDSCTANFWLSEFCDQYFINLVSIPLKYPGSEERGSSNHGFGGRAATYKRADLLFYDLDFRMRLDGRSWTHAGICCRQAQDSRRQHVVP